jgi:hypothetical protein
VNPQGGRQRPLGPSIVYRFYDNEDELLYVGCTQNVKRRFAEHFPPRSPRSGWRAEVARIEKTPAYPDRRSAEEAEARAIFTEGPLFNAPNVTNAAYKRLFGSTRIPDPLPRIRERIARGLGTDPGAWAYGRRREPVRVPYADLAVEVEKNAGRYCIAPWLVDWAQESGPDPWGEAIDLAWTPPDGKLRPSGKYAHAAGSWHLP